MAVTALITGADGFIGSHLCRHLSSAGYDIIAAVRKSCGDKARYMSCKVAVGDMGGDIDWTEALSRADVVVHSAARVHVLSEQSKDPIGAFRRVNVEATEKLARQAAQAGCKRFVFISTIGVLGPVSDHPLSEEDQPAPKNPYALSKWEAEQALWEVAKETGLKIVILRMPLVYGPGVKANFLSLMNCVAHSIPLPFGGIENARDFLSVTNLCDAVQLCLVHENAADEVFHLCDGEAVSTADLIRGISEAADKSPKLWPVPAWMLRFGLRLIGKAALYNSVCCSLRVDDSKLRRTLGWHPPQSLKEGLQQAVDWYQKANVV